MARAGRPSALTVSSSLKLLSFHNPGKELHEFCDFLSFRDLLIFLAFLDRKEGLLPSLGGNVSMLRKYTRVTNSLPQTQLLIN